MGPTARRESQSAVPTPSLPLEAVRPYSGTHDAVHHGVYTAVLNLAAAGCHACAAAI